MNEDRHMLLCRCPFLRIGNVVKARAKSSLEESMSEARKRLAVETPMVLLRYNPSANTHVKLM
jgi:hypothetical protein